MANEAGPLKVREYAAWAGVTPWTVRQWIKHGKLKARKVGHDWRIDPAEKVSFTPDEQTKEPL
jgi:excisionase family DNA binding protein